MYGLIELSRSARFDCPQQSVTVPSDSCAILFIVGAREILHWSSKDSSIRLSVKTSHLFISKCFGKIRKTAYSCEVTPGWFEKA